MPKTVVIIPAYNEEKRIASVIDGIRNTGNDCDVLVINDGSTDSTAGAALQAGAFVVSHPFNLGYGAALQTGYKYAIRNDYDFLVQMDGDGQHDPSYMKDLLIHLETARADVVIGSRFLQPAGKEAQEYSYPVPLARKAGMRLFGAITSLLIGQEVTDSTSGYQAMGRNVFEAFASDRFPIDYPDADVIIMLHRAGYKIMEVPVKMYGNPENKSMHSGLKPVYYVFKMLLSILVTLMRK